MSNQEASKKKRMIEYLIITVLVLSLLMDYGYLIVNSNKNQYDIRLKEAAKQAAIGIEQVMTDAVTFVEAIAEIMSEYEDIHSEEALDCLRRVNTKSNFTRMWLTKADGSAISTEGESSNATGRPYLESGLKGESGISEIQISRVNGEKNVVVYAPVCNKDGITGLVIGIYKLNDLTRVVDINCFDRSGYCSLIRENGEVIVKTSDSETATPGKYSYTHKTEINDWCVFVELPLEFIYEDIRQQLLFSTMLCLKFMILIAYLLAKKHHGEKVILERLAYSDSLTSLMNRGTIEENIKKNIENNEKKKYVFIIIDVDHFKLINDTIGHMSGDYLLKKIADYLDESFGECGLVSRLGGDEFAVFCREFDSMEEIYGRMNSFADKVKELNTVNKWKEEISISAGVVVYPDEGTDFESLYKAADRKMYQIKAKGGNGVQY